MESLEQKLQDIIANATATKSQGNINWPRLITIGLVVVLVLFIACVCIRRAYYRRKQDDAVGTGVVAQAWGDMEYVLGKVRRPVKKGRKGPKAVLAMEEEEEVEEDEEEEVEDEVEDEEEEDEGEEEEEEDEGGNTEELRQSSDPGFTRLR